MDLSTWRACAARRCALVSGVAWVAVFLVASATGESFDSVSFAGRWQLVPIENLRADPFGSVWNLHVQPPLWNLMIGVIDRWSPLPFRFSLEALMVAFGFVAAVLLCDTLRRIGLRPRWAVSLTLFVLCAPDVLLNAFEPRYELMTTTGLIAMAWVIVRGSAASERTRWLVTLAVLATAVTMIRTVYHPLWLVALLAIFAWRWRDAVTRRGLATTALVPLLIVGGWMLKNEYLVGRFTLTTWSGMNLQRTVIPLLHADDKQAMLASGELSEISAAGPFLPYDAYAPLLGPCVPTSSSPVLNRLDRDPPYTEPNFNNECYLRAFDLAGEDAKAAIRAHPDAYIEGRLWSTRRWFALNDTFEASDSKPLVAMTRLYRIVEVGVPGKLVVSNFGTPIFGTTDVENHFSLLAVACSIAVLLAALRRRGPHRDLYVFVGLLTAWTFASGVLFELGEQPRFRSMIDPLVFAFGLVLLVDWGAAFVRARRHGAAPQQEAASS